MLTQGAIKFFTLESMVLSQPKMTLWTFPQNPSKVLSHDMQLHFYMKQLFQHFDNPIKEVLTKSKL